MILKAGIEDAELDFSIVALLTRSTQIYLKGIFDRFFMASARQRARAEMMPGLQDGRRYSGRLKKGFGFETLKTGDIMAVRTSCDNGSDFNGVYYAQNQHLSSPYLVLGVQKGEGLVQLLLPFEAIAIGSIEPSSGN